MRATGQYFHVVTFTFQYCAKLILRLFFGLEFVVSYLTYPLPLSPARKWMNQTHASMLCFTIVPIQLHHSSVCVLNRNTTRICMYLGSHMITVAICTCIREYQFPSSEITVMDSTECFKILVNAHILAWT